MEIVRSVVKVMIPTWRVLVTSVLVHAAWFGLFMWGLFTVT